MVDETRLEASNILLDKITEHKLDFDIIATTIKENSVISTYISSALGKELEFISIEPIMLDNNGESLIVGSICFDGTVWLDRQFSERENLDEELNNQLKKEMSKSRSVAETKLGQPKSDNYSNQFKDKNVLIVEEGIINNRDLMPAIGLMKKQGARNITVCSPVAPRDVVLDINTLVDSSLILNQPYFLESIEEFYEENKKSKENRREAI